MLQNCEGGFLGALAFHACGADTRRAAALARARRDQLASALQQKLVNAIERLAESDAAGIGVVEIQIRLEVFFQLGRIV